jgi:membrane-associated phospholipid phosphatase
MFQTGLHIALQSQASDWLTWLMLQVTALGYHEIIILIVVAVVFGIGLRQGFLLFQVIFWTSTLSGLAKQFFGLPRPFFADARVACLEPSWNTSGAFTAQGGRGFLDLPAREVIDAFRLKRISFGFPSGHTSSAFAVWGGLAVVLRRRWLAWLAALMIALIAFSRLYLGVHFLADILGGALLGGLVLLAAWRLWRSDGRRAELFAALGGTLAPLARRGAYLAFLFGLPLLLAAFSLGSMTFTGLYVGMNAAYFVLVRRGLPADAGSLPVRLARVLLGGIIFSLLAWGLRQLVVLVPALAGAPWGRFLAAALATFLCFWLGMELYLRLGLYRKPAAGG